MTTQRILVGKYRQPVSGHDGKPLLSIPKYWSGPVVERLSIPTSGECGPQFTGMPVICTSPLVPGHRWYKHAISVKEVPVPPNGIDSLSSSYERDYERWICEPGHETLCVRFHQTVVDKSLQDEALGFDIETRFAHNDPILVNLIHELAVELQREFPNGILYAEGLSLMLIGWLKKHYASEVHRRKDLTGRFSLAQKQRITEFIEANICGQLTLDSMASELNMSTFHFVRFFRLTFETTPHQYVLNRRLTLAAHILKMSRESSISDVAFDYGFSSQAHFTTAFRHRFGETPGKWRSRFS